MADEATILPPASTLKPITQSPLPREIIKWVQSLDLSFIVKNPKRDLSNGFLVAEIFSRYYPKDVNINSYENGTRLACKVNNWEQLYRFARKKELGVTKQEIDPVIHCVDGAAISFMFHIYQMFTKRAAKFCAPAPGSLSAELGAPVLPAFMRDTASKRLKDNGIARIQDDVERTIHAIDVLGGYHEERRTQKAFEAPLLIQQERRSRTLPGADYDTSSKEEVQDSQQMSEVRVKALSAGAAGSLQGKASKAAEGQKQKTAGVKLQLLKAVSTPPSSVGALAHMQQPALFVKPAADIMRPLALSVLQESEELSKVIDTRKDVIVSFMEQCREGLPDVSRERGAANSAKMREIEETSARVFETLANRAQLLVDTLTKSPPEFWKVWSTFFPALSDFSEASPVFDSAVFLFKRIGDLMREADPVLTQQLITEVGMPALARELARSPEKRECLCEILYSYTQEDTLNHLMVLRALKDKIGDNLPVYISCLSCLISLDAQLSLLDEHLLDLYNYYALVAMQSPQPRVRVAGVSILSTITICSTQHHTIVALIPSFGALANDDWWEVQAQLLLLSANLLSKLSLADRQDAGSSAGEGAGSASSRADGLDGSGTDAAQEALLNIISRLFVVSTSKNVLQVGLSALVHMLAEYPTLLPMFVTVLVEQPPEYRNRLLQPAGEGGDDSVSRKTYVLGNTSRMYEEKCVSQLWPHLDVAKTLVMQVGTTHTQLKVEHMEVLLASLPEQLDEIDTDEWVAVFDKVRPNLFDAFIDPELHAGSCRVIRRFWTISSEAVATRTLEVSKKSLLQALQELYSADVVRPKVDEESVLAFLGDMMATTELAQLELKSVVESFAEVLPEEYKASQLHTLI